MKISSYFHVLVLILIVLMLIIPFQTLTHAQKNPVYQYDVYQRQPLYGVEDIDPRMDSDSVSLSDEKQALADAKRDVKIHINKTLWFTAGCFFPIFGPAFSQRNQRTFPIARTLGKSPEYIAFYTDAYKIEMKKQRYNWSLYGCILGGLTDACLAGLLISNYTN